MMSPDEDATTYTLDRQLIPLPFDRERMIVLVYAGSIAHGTHIPPAEDPSTGSGQAFGTDDLDVMGVFVPPPDHLLGVRPAWEGVSSDAGHVDYTFYSLQKVVRLLLKGNPNVLALLWVRDQDVIWRRPAYDLLRERRHLFAAKSVYESFVAYAKSQVGRMGGGAYQGYMGARRKRLVDQYGYDPKMASHLIRLLRMGVEFLESGVLRVWRGDLDGDELLAIKRGQWPLERVQAEADRLFALAERGRDESRLPERPDVATADKLLIELMLVYVCGETR